MRNETPSENVVIFDNERIDAQTSPDLARLSFCAHYWQYYGHQRALIGGRRVSLLYPYPIPLSRFLASCIAAWLAAAVPSAEAALRGTRQGRPVRSICWRKSSPRRGGGDIDFAVFYILPPIKPLGWGKMATRQNRVFSPLRGVASHAPSPHSAPKPRITTPKQRVADKGVF